MKELRKDSTQFRTIEKGYGNTLEYISDELSRIDLLIKLALKRRGAKSDPEKSSLAGLYISEQEVDRLLEKEDPEDPSAAAELEASIAMLEDRINRRSAKATSDEGTTLPALRLKEIFGLTPFEINSLLICLAPEMDSRYEKLYAYLQDDLTKKYPTIELIFTLLTRTLDERVQAREYFSEYAPLVQWQLVGFAEDQREQNASLLSRPLRIDERIALYLTGAPAVDSKTKGLLNVIKPGTELEKLYVPEGLKEGLINLANHFKDAPSLEKCSVVYFHGPRGSGKTQAAEAVCRDLNVALLEVDAERLLYREAGFLSLFQRILREALLVQGCLLIRNFDLLLSDNGTVPYLRKHLLAEIQNCPIPTFLAAERDWEPGSEFDGAGIIKLHFPVPDFQLRRRIWKNFMNDKKILGSGLTIDDLASRFRFTEGQIKGAVSTALKRRVIQLGENDGFSEGDLLAGCRAQSNRKLSELAIKVESGFSWKDIILPQEHLGQIKEICWYLKHREKVYKQWGFDSKISSGRGISVLFSGPSGTGKTMASGIIANELRLELYKIDLSTVVSKYIGETEKNLKRIFEEAETSNAVLFFDEADALFGKRSEVKDAHDRYANIEIGYLLMKMEEYEGVVILATNLNKNIDRAFLRRMQFMVEFPFPDEAQRELIWKGIFPGETPLSKDIDFKFLSARLKVAGGNIKNMALAAAFHAAQDSAEITMYHVIHAARREYQKIGKPFVKTDLAPYYDLIEKKER